MARMSNAVTGAPVSDAMVDMSMAPAGTMVLRDGGVSPALSDGGSTSSEKSGKLKFGRLMRRVVDVTHRVEAKVEAAVPAIGRKAKGAKLPSKAKLSALARGLGGRAAAIPRHLHHGHGKGGGGVPVLEFHEPRIDEEGE